MTASQRIEPNFASTIGLAEAIYFDSGDHTLFGWIHRPAAGSVTRTGLVICPPFGYEAICSHRSLRAFADAAAKIGLPALRFDYVGTGDSADILPQPDQLDLWSRDVLAAVAELKRCTGVEQVCLLGFRLGAMLAMRAANQCKTVSALILVAPVISGRQYLRELRTMRLASSLGAESTEIEPSPGEGFMEVGGFSLTAATVEALAEIDLTRVAAPSVSEILVIDRSDLPAARAWAEALAGVGIRTQYRSLPGFVEMMLTPPQFAVVPLAMIGAMRDWLPRVIHEPSPPREDGAGLRRDGLPAGVSAVLSLPCAAAPENVARLTERPVIFGCADVLFGIITEPAQDYRRRGGVILLNSGADHHIGASRMYVSLARRWAESGYVVLRMDLAGLGDSGTRREQADNEVFPPTALEDIGAAVDFIRGRYGVDDITLGGLCSGAYHALRAAVAGFALKRILMINPQNFFWKDGATLEDLQLAEVVRNPVVYRERVLSALAWRRLLTGRVNVWRLVAVFIHRFLLALESEFRDLARRLGMKLPRDLGWELEEIGARGIDAIFVFAHGDPGIGLLKLQAGSSLHRLGDRLRVHIVHGADHNFSRSGPRAKMERILCEELFDDNEWTGHPPTSPPVSPIAREQVHLN